MTNLGDKVKTKTGKHGGISAKGIIVGFFYQNSRPSGKKTIQVFHDNNAVYNYDLEDVSELKTQTLYAYKDATDEVHWATREYDNKERSSFGFVEASEFNKTIDLE